VEREVVLRLASLLWRLRRATRLETGLYDIQAEDICGVVKAEHQIPPISRAVVRTATNLSTSADLIYGSQSAADAKEICIHSTQKRPLPSNSSAAFAECFLRLVSLPNYALDHLSRYEAMLWRQVSAVLLALDALERRKPQERRRVLRQKSTSSVSASLDLNDFTK
jgi:hypothetical protein